MAGRDRRGVDARGSIGDKEYITMSGGQDMPARSKLAFGIFPRKAMGLGMLVILAGFVIWLWPIIYVFVRFLSSLSTGPQVVGWGFVLIFLSILSRLVLNPIIDMLLR
ncbi:MAG: hypothetical protein ABH834_02745 [Candidatus Altiarchaeota archaeon]